MKHGVIQRLGFWALCCLALLFTHPAIALVRNITEQHEFAIYEFSERPILLQDFTSDVALLTRAIQGIGPGLSTTNLYGAVSEGLTRWTDTFSLQEIDQGFLIVLTDGRDTQGLHTIQSVLFQL